MRKAAINPMESGALASGSMPAAMLGVLSGAAVVVGASLPWLSVFKGLDAYSGSSGTNGRLLAAGGAGVMLLALWQAIRPAAARRRAIGAAGFVLAMFCAYLLAQLLSVYNALQDGYLPAIGPGLLVATAGSLLAMSTVFLTQRSESLDATSSLRAGAVALVALSAGAGAVHLAVAAEHFVEFRLYGAFFVVLGVAQIAWAAALALRGTSRKLALIACANAAVVGVWVVSRTVGLPIGPDPGSAESIGFPDALATAFELVLAGWAVWSLVRAARGGRVARPWVRYAAWALPLVIAVASIAAVVNAGGHTGASS
jgi:hypothetical protein